MPSRYNGFWWLLACAVILRLVSMTLVPFADTSEPRYAEMARLMAATGDWITPWFNLNVPFWGKPPLSFWSQAFAINLLGDSELAVRLPSLLATLATLGLLYRAASQLFNGRAALWTLVIYFTCALTYVAAGAVLTDPFLTLSTTWVLVSFLLLPTNNHWIWRYGLFGGMALGLLAKGPLVLVLVGGSTLPALWSADFRRRLLQLPWLTGSLLTLALVLPWYVLAELKTPGFLRYFLLGEHILRFIDPGWQGDLYGSAHRRAHGTIWLFALMATFPWGFVGLWLLARRLRQKKAATSPMPVSTDARWLLLWGWTLFTPLFFTMAGNILWTYVLPALPAFALLLAHAFTRELNTIRWSLRPLGWLTPVAVAVATVYVAFNPASLSTEKSLMAFVDGQATQGPVTYVGDAPFSARYYSEEKVTSVGKEELTQWLEQQPAASWLAISRHNKTGNAQLQEAGFSPLYQNKRYQLYLVAPTQVATENPPASEDPAAGGS